MGEAGQLQSYLIRDYAAALTTAVKKGFGDLLPGKNPSKFLFLKSNPFIGGILAQVSLKK
jgi:hypothetical protein